MAIKNSTHGRGDVNVSVTLDDYHHHHSHNQTRTKTTSKNPQHTQTIAKQWLEQHNTIDQRKHEYVPCECYN